MSHLSGAPVARVFFQVGFLPWEGKEMELKVVTTDGRRGEIASSLLAVNAFQPVEVRFPDGKSAKYYLRELHLVAETLPSSTPRLCAS